MTNQIDNADMTDEGLALENMRRLSKQAMITLLKSFEYNQAAEIVREVFAEINYGQLAEVRPLENYKILDGDSFAKQFCD